MTFIFAGYRNEFLNLNSQFSTGGKIPTQEQINNLGNHLLQSNMVRVGNATIKLMNEKRVDNYDGKIKKKGN